MNPKFRCHHDTQVSNTAKYAKYSWQKRGYFIRDIISPSGVNKTDKTQAIPEFAHESPFFMNVCFLFLFVCLF